MDKVNYNTYTFRPRWVVFTEKLSVVVMLGCTFSLNCIVQPSVTATESFSLKMTQRGRNM
jgi:hypothetical protein